jgi:hypothetical protein
MFIYEDYDIDETPAEVPSPVDLRLAKRFIELVGSPERAHELIDKCSNCLTVLGVDDETNDAQQVEQIASMTPDSPDQPAGFANNNMAAMYDPNHQTQ